MNTLIAFTCAAKAHQASEAGPDRWTVHEGKWAYCGYDARADGHEWKANDGLTLSMLQQAGAIRLHTGGEDPTKKR